MIKKILITAGGIAVGIYATGYVAGQEWAQNIQIPGGVSTVTAGIGFLVAANTKGDVSKVAFLAGAGALAPVLLEAGKDAASDVTEDHRAPSQALSQYHAAHGAMMNRYVDAAVA